MGNRGTQGQEGLTDWLDCQYQSNSELRKYTAVLFQGTANTKHVRWN